MDLSGLSDIHLFSLFIQAIPLVFAAIFPVLNPIGSALIVLPLTSGLDVSTRLLIARKVALNTLIVLTAVLIAGSYFLAFFGISVPVVQAAGGMVLFSMGWKALSADDPIDKPPDAGPRGKVSEQTFYPFTFPITVGPGTVAITLTLSAHTTQPNFTETLVSQCGAFIAFIALAGTVYLCFAYAGSLVKRAGPSGANAINRLMAFIILCIGAQISWGGIHSLLGTVHF